MPTSMSGFCGVYLLSGGALSSRLSVKEKLAMSGQLGGTGAECPTGPVWLFSSCSGKIAGAAGRCLAIEGGFGFVNDGPRTIEALLASGAPRPELLLNGHFSLAHFSGTELTLFRDPSSWERLFYIVSDGFLVFSTSVKPLLAFVPSSRRMDRGAACEFLLNGALVSGHRTLFAGIKELLPGNTLAVSRGRLEQRATADLLAPSEDRFIDTPSKFRRGLLEAVGAAIGTDKEIAISLSGGVDSAVIAACAVELLGAKNVHAFTYEFDDPAHLSEAAEAANLCAYFGSPHQVFKLSLPEYLAELPEALWLMEEPPVLVPRTRLSLFSKKVRAAGFSKILTGHGMEQIVGIMQGEYLGALARLLRFLPAAGKTLAYWRLSFRHGDRLAQRAGKLLSRLHPGLALPYIADHYPALFVLKLNGVIDDISAFYPAELRPLARAAFEDISGGGLYDALRARPLAEQLLYVKYAWLERKRIMSTMSITRLAGASQVSPAMALHPGALAGYFRGRPPVGRKLLREAMTDCLPRQSLYREKRNLPVGQTVLSEKWFNEIMKTVRSAGAGSRKFLLENYFKDYAGGEKFFCRTLGNCSWCGGAIPMDAANLSALALWHKVHVEGGMRPVPPGWAGLGASL